MRIYHHSDLDGRCAAAIALRWARKRQGSLEDLGLIKIETIGIDYKDKIEVESFSDGQYVIIVDFSFKPEIMKEVLRRGAHVIWIDHHKTASEYNYGVNVPGLRDFTDKGKAGCELAWEYFNPEKVTPRAVELIGDYDKWALKFQPECFWFYEGLKMEVTIPQSALWYHLFEGNAEIETEILTQGKAAIRYRDNYCEEVRRAYGYETVLDGHRAFATNFYMFGSRAFGDLMDKYDFCIAYIHDGGRFAVSLYSAKEIDVSEVAKKFGGGGHKGAAGFVCDILPFRP